MRERERQRERGEREEDVCLITHKNSAYFHSSFDQDNEDQPIYIIATKHYTHLKGEQLNIGARIDQCMVLHQIIWCMLFMPKRGGPTLCVVDYNLQHTTLVHLEYLLHVLNHSKRKKTCIHDQMPSFS